MLALVEWLAAAIVGVIAFTCGRVLLRFDRMEQRQRRIELALTRFAAHMGLELKLDE